MADNDITAHYERPALLEAIRAGLVASGVDLDRITPDDLAPVDEFHVGGRPATKRLFEQLAPSRDDQLLDVGAGIGGTARYATATFGCSVTGIDLTPEYVDVARALSEWSGHDSRHEFIVGSALDTGLAANSFDLATQLHVGMNIADKPTLFAEIHRVLRPGGRYAIYDIMRTSDDPFTFPVPWATEASMSHVVGSDAYLGALTDVGFEIVTTHDRGDAARSFFDGLRQPSDSGPPPLGLHLVMGPDAPIKYGNMVAAVVAGTLAPTEIVARKPG